MGLGNGALTDEIIRKKPKSLIIIERTLLAKNLREKYFFNKNVHVYNSDILKFDIEKISKKTLLSLKFALQLFYLKFS